MKTLYERNFLLNNARHGEDFVFTLVDDTVVRKGMFTDGGDNKYYLAFFNGNPEEDGNEIPVQRKEVKLNPAEHGYRVSNEQIVVDTSNLPVIEVAKYWGVFDAQTHGHLLYYFKLPYDVKLVKNSNIEIKPGNLVINEG